MIYKFFLFIHSWMRWLVLVLMLLSLIVAISSLLKKSAFSSHHERLFRFSRIVFGVELLIGILLYFIWSPVVTQVLYHGLSLFESRYFFFTLKHPLTMFAAFILCKIVENKALKASNDQRKFKIWFWGNLAVLMALLLAIPWPFYKEVGRSLFRY